MNHARNNFEKIVNACANELYRFAYGLCHHTATAEDLVQETFLRAWRSREQLRDLKAARAWLFRILRNEHARLYQRQRPQVIDPALLPDVPVQGYDTSAEAFALRQNLMHLSIDYREPLLLQVIGGFSTKEIGEFLNISQGAVMSRVHRARKKLKQQLLADTHVEQSK